jgi:hypothetical protein
LHQEDEGRDERSQLGVVWLDERLGVKRPSHGRWAGTNDERRKNVTQRVTEAQSSQRRKKSKTEARLVVGSK